MSVPSSFLDRIRAIYPSDSGLNNPWYILAAVAFSASNMPEAVPQVFSYVLSLLPNGSSLDERRVVARKLREALFKSGLLSGYPKVGGYTRVGIPR